jgi:hypothetical protein
MTNFGKHDSGQMAHHRRRRAGTFRFGGARIGVRDDVGFGGKRNSSVQNA